MCFCFMRESSHIQYACAGSSDVAHLFPEGEAPVVEEVSIGRIQADGLAEVCNSSLVVSITIPSDAPVVVGIAV